MERELAAAGIAANNGRGAIHGQIFWEEVCLLGSVSLGVTHDMLGANVDCGIYRLGEVYAVEIPRRNCGYEWEIFQGRRGY